MYALFLVLVTAGRDTDESIWRFRLMGSFDCSWIALTAVMPFHLSTIDEEQRFDKRET